MREKSLVCFQQRSGAHHAMQCNAAELGGKEQVFKGFQKFGSFVSPSEHVRYVVQKPGQPIVPRISSSSPPPW